MIQIFSESETIQCRLIIHQRVRVHRIYLLNQTKLRKACILEYRQIKNTYTFIVLFIFFFSRNKYLWKRFLIVEERVSDFVLDQVKKMAFIIFLFQNKARAGNQAVVINESLQIKRLSHTVQRATTKLGNFQRPNIGFTSLALLSECRKRLSRILSSIMP